VSAARHAEQAWQLGHGNGQPGAGLEADQDAVADQLHKDAQPEQPGQQAEHGHRECGEAGDLCVVLRIALRHRSHGCGNHERDGRRRADGQLAGRPEQRVSEPAQQVAVHADLRRQACKSGIGEGDRDRVRRQRNTGNNVAVQPVGAVLR
jgi:hypothetical protein